ncbi:MAG: hypothetical protein FWE12_09005 [Oscillospiraceae bacterium]|nr:hypothetical protein [Oscillospiraceae bacterium]
MPPTPWALFSFFIFYLDDDKIVIGLNYDKGTKTLLFSELEDYLAREGLGSYLENAAPPAHYRDSCAPFPPTDCGLWRKLRYAIPSFALKGGEATPRFWKGKVKVKGIGVL